MFKLRSLKKRGTPERCGGASKCLSGLLIPFLIILFQLINSAPVLGSEPVRVTVKSRGLAAPFLSYAIEKRLEKMEGVDTFTLNSIVGTVEIIFKDKESADREEIKKLFEETGLTAEKIRIRGLKK